MSSFVNQKFHSRGSKWHSLEMMRKQHPQRPRWSIDFEKGSSTPRQFIILKKSTCKMVVLLQTELWRSPSKSCTSWEAFCNQSSMLSFKENNTRHCSAELLGCTWVERPGLSCGKVPEHRNTRECCNLMQNVMVGEMWEKWEMQEHYTRKQSGCLGDHCSESLAKGMVLFKALLLA